MPTVNASGTVVAVADSDDGEHVVISIHSRRTIDSGEPSFKLTYEFPSSSAAIAAYPLDTIVEFAITTTPPAVDQITSTAIFTPPETQTEAPVADAPAAPEIPAGAIVTPVDDGGDPLITLQTPASDVPPPVLNADQPAVPQAGLSNMPIADVKAQLGL